MKGCFNLFIGLILATLAAFVIGGGVCLVGFGMLHTNDIIATIGNIMIFGAIPVGIIAFCFVLVKWINREPARPAGDTSDSTKQTNQTDKINKS